MTFRFIGETYRGYAAVRALAPVAPEDPIIMSGCCNEPIVYGENILPDGGVESHQLDEYIGHELQTGAFPDASSEGIQLIEAPDVFPLTADNIVYKSRVGQTFTVFGASSHADSAFFNSGPKAGRKWVPYVSAENPDTGTKHLRLTEDPDTATVGISRSVYPQPAYWCSLIPHMANGLQIGAAAFLVEGDVVTTTARVMSNRNYTVGSINYPRVQASMTWRDVDGVAIQTGVATPTGNAISQVTLTTSYVTYDRVQVAPVGAYAVTVEWTFIHGNPVIGSGLVHVDADNFVLGVAAA